MERREDKIIEKTNESFDNYFTKVNIDLYNGYSKEFVDYLFKEFGDKWDFHLKFESEKYYPLTLLGNQETLKDIHNLPDNVYYYIKKRDGSYGRHITITKNPHSYFINNKEKNQYVIQREINSLLYKNRKFDYRIYLLILKKDNKIKYGYYKKYVIRNCVRDMNSETDKYSKITNHHIYSLEGLDKDFYILSDDFELDHSKKINRLNERVLDKIKEYENDFYNLLGDKQFRILGIDYIVERGTDKLYLLEINITPGVYYKNVSDDFFIKYNNFHYDMICELNDIIYNNKIINYVFV